MTEQENRHSPVTTPTDESRLARLERTVADLAAAVESLAARDASGSRAGTEDGERSQGARPPDASGPPARGSDSRGPEFWALDALKQRLPAPGGVVYAGSVDIGLGHVEYQWGRPTDPLLRADWSERAERIAALGHPLRISMLHHLLDGERTVAQLVDELDLGSTGIAYHHLNQLQGAGWVTSPSRGTWTIPASRIVPLLAIITALEEA